jgi:hypothetical protein
VLAFPLYNFNCVEKSPLGVRYTPSIRCASLGCLRDIVVGGKSEWDECSLTIGSEGLIGLS